MRNITKHIITFVLLLISFLSFSQDWQHSYNQYAFLNLDKNKLKIKNRIKSDYAFSKLQNILEDGYGELNIVHVGGSHVQAGFWTNVIRENLYSLGENIEGDFGFAFPFACAKTYNPTHYRSSTNDKWEISKINETNNNFDMGIGGICCRTYNQDANVTIRHPRFIKDKNQFDKIYIFYHNSDSSYNPILNADSLIIKEELISDIGKYYELEKDIDSLSFSLEKENQNQNSFDLNGVYLSNSNQGICVNSIGITGASTESYLKIKNSSEYIKIINPDIVIFSIGVNDAAKSTFTKDDFFNNYSIICDSILAVKPNCLFIFTSNNDFYHYNGQHNAKYEDVNSAMLELSEKYNGAFWNMFEIMGGANSINSWKENNLAKDDRIHFTEKGYKILGDLFVNAFIKEYTYYLLKNCNTE